MMNKHVTEVDDCKLFRKKKTSRQFVFGFECAREI